MKEPIQTQAKSFNIYTQGAVALAIGDTLSITIKWRKENKLSQRQAAKAMNEAEVPINSTTLQQWEYGRHAPSPLAAKLVTKFLDEHPQITRVPDGNKTKLTAEDLVEISQRSKNGEKLREIADSFGLSRSYVSRILKGERRPRVGA